MFIISIILLQVIIFAGLAFFLRYFLKSNVTNATSHLQGMIQDNSEKQEEIKKKLEESEEQYQDMIRKAKREAADLKEKAVKETEAERDKIIDAAHKESEDLLDRAQKTCENIRSQLQEQIDKEAIKRSSDLICRVISEEIRKIMHQEWIEALISDGLSDLSRLRIPDKIKEIEVFTAFALNKKQKQEIEKKFKESLEIDIKIKETVKDDLIAGMVITVGNLIFDGSFTSKITEVVRESLAQEKQ
ncbi:MAG: F0F1 ATP synthase subunit delta [Candidatus Omnitrophota bacterium]